MPRYENLTSLPFIATELDELADALRHLDVDVVPFDTDHTDRTRLEQAIYRFCQGARPGQPLLILLSGHGMSHGKDDYLVAGPADPSGARFVEECLPLNFRDAISDSRCGDVVVLIDACREPIRWRKGDATPWSRAERERVARRRVAYLYACREGQFAGYGPDDAPAYSIFTRAFTEVVRDPAGPVVLDDVREAVQTRMNALLAELGRTAPQQTKIEGEPAETAHLVVLPRPGWGDRRDEHGEHQWVTTARTHHAWSLTPDPEPLRSATLEVVGHLADLYERQRAAFSDDPWRDDRMAQRASRRGSWLLRKHLDPAVLSRWTGPRAPSAAAAVSRAEAVLVVVLPFLHETYGVVEAARVRQMIPSWSEALRGEGEHGVTVTGFAQSAGRAPRLLRRAAQLATESEARPDAESCASAIYWWLFHRWLLRRPETYAESSVAELLTMLDDIAGRARSTASGVGEERRLVRSVLTAPRLASMMRLLRLGPAEVTRPGSLTALRRQRMLEGGDADEDRLREQLLALLLLVAHRFAIEPVSLGNVVVDHVGIADPLHPHELLATLRLATWTEGARARTLEASCAHQAVDVALTQHVAETSTLLQRLDTLIETDRTLEALSGLPTHVTAEEVRARVVNRVPAYDSRGLRFRLADDRIQELLMGERLYGDRALAIRELYQNALDACRYRAARSEYLRRAAIAPPPWDGEIHFTQGTEDGRPFLSCRDNGIGMGRTELEDVFFNAGVRFTDLPSFVEERARWTDREIDFFANSQFGVGVLSYFMLADEITVETCRLGEDGRPGDRLKVSISGPGSLCRIRRLDPGGDAGTTVTLHLRPAEEPVASVAFLTETLWLSEFLVTATDGADESEWRPRSVSRPSTVAEEITGAEEPPVVVVPTDDARVFWCSVDGALLADGLFMSTARLPAVVNLVGPLAPELTVDRKTMLHHDAAEVRRLVEKAVPALLDDEVALLQPTWLDRIVDIDAPLADAIAVAAADGGYRAWRVGEQDVDTSVVGCFPPDQDLFRGGDVVSTVSTADRVAEPLAHERLRVWAGLGLLPGLTATVDVAAHRALPGDRLVLGINAGPWLEDTVSPGAVLIAAFRTGRRPAAVARRLAELGYTVPDEDWPAGVDPDDLALLNRNRTREGENWLDPATPVAINDVVRAATDTGRTPAEVAARLTTLGYTLPAVTWPTTVEPDDLTLLSRDRDRRGPWLDPAVPVTIDHILYAATHSGRAPAEVAARLTTLGYAVPTVVPPTTLEPDDLALLGPDHLSASWPDGTGPVAAGWVLRAADLTGRPPAEVAARLSALGYTVSVLDWPMAAERRDLVLLSADHDGLAPWLSLSRLAAPVNLIRATARGDWPSPQAVADRLVELGVPLQDRTWPDEVDFDDEALLSRDLDRSTPWLELDEPVSVGRVLRAAAHLRRPPDVVAARYRAFNFTVPDGPWAAELTSHDASLLVREFGDDEGAVNVTTPIATGQVLRAAERLRTTAAEVADQLRQLDFMVPDREWPAAFDADDVTLLSYNLDRNAPWLEAADPVAVGQVLRAAEHLRRPPAELAHRMGELGLTVPAHEWPTTFDTDDVRLASRDLSETGSWLDLSVPVSATHLLGAAQRLRRPVGAVARRLVELGARLPAGLQLTDGPG